MVLLALPYQQSSVTYHENGTHYTWWETLTTPDSSCGGGYYVKTLPFHERSWWWSPTLARWRRIQWTLEDVTRSVTGPGWDLHWSWAYMDAYECHEERYPPGVVFPLRRQLDQAMNAAIADGKLVAYAVAESQPLVLSPPFHCVFHIS